jgi:tetratricopeptide (TPR) repeat protein
MRTLLVVAALVAIAALSVPLPECAAGGGPETTVVVVNADSPLSLQLANEYVRRRGIPTARVCRLEGVPTLAVVDVDTFRARLWGPVKAFLERGGLLERTDLLVWSADFPYGVDFAADKKVEGKAPYTPIASLTAMTYAWRRVEAKDADGYLDLLSNGYYRRGPGEGGAGREVSDEEAILRSDAQTFLVDKKWEEAAATYAKLLATLRHDAESQYNYACCLARLGRTEEALTALGAAVDAGFDLVAHAEDDPDLEALRALPGFKAVLERMRSASKGAVQPSRAFSSRWAWTGGVEADRAPAPDARGRYLLSTMLAYTGPWGNSVPEALAALGASIDADGTNPDGTFYFLVNGDVRAKTREPRFAGAIAALEAMGRKAKLLVAGQDGQTGVLPVRCDDVLGAMAGTASFDWAKSGSRILPGAICEHLTSFGAMFNSGSQTKLSEWVRHGAAGSSGAVFEPYALQQKFPVPHLQVHYAAGCSLAEAFFQSVWGPYQLLVVGDGLARPFARFAQVSLVAPKAPLAGTAILRPDVVAAAGRPVERLELFVDGVFVGEGRPEEGLSWDTTQVEDGPHEVDLVAVEADPVGTRSRARAILTVGNGKAVATISGPRSVGYDDTVVFLGKAPGAKEVVLRLGTHELGRAKVQGVAWKVSFPARAVGVGTVRVQGQAIYAQGPASRTPFHELAVTPPSLRKAIRPTDKTKGWRVEAQGGEGSGPITLKDLGGPGKEGVAKALTAQAKGAKAFVIAGEFGVPEDGAYRLFVQAAGELEVEVDGRPLLPETSVASGRGVGVLVGLAKGAHALRIRYAPSGAPDLTVLLGGQIVTVPFEARR